VENRGKEGGFIIVLGEMGDVDFKHNQACACEMVGDQEGGVGKEFFQEDEEDIVLFTK